MLRAEYAKKGIKFLLSTKVVGVSKEETGITVSYENADGTGTVTADKLLMSVGRRPVTKRFRIGKSEFGMDGAQMHQSR